MSPWSETVWNDGASPETSHRKRPVVDKFTYSKTTTLSVELCNYIKKNDKENVYDEKIETKSEKQRKKLTPTSTVTPGKANTCAGGISLGTYR